MTDEKPPEQSSSTPMPDTLPILPITDSVLFPKMVFPLLVMAPDSVQLVDETMSRDRMVGMVFVKPDEASESPPKPGNYAAVGTSAMILKMAKTPDNRTQLLVQGLGRFRIKQLSQAEGKPFWQAAVEHLAEDVSRDTETEALMANIVNLFARIVQYSPTLPPEVVYMAQSIKEPGTLADMIASSLNATAEEKQKVLEILPVGERLKEVTRIVNKQLEILDLGKKIQDQVKGDLDKKQREYYLREQLKAIKTELGDKDEGTVEVEEYRTKIKEKGLPPEAAREAERELERLARMHPSSAEYTVATTFLDWLTALPWHQNTADNLDIKKARKVLDDDHFGLEKPKRRIIEYLAVRKLKPDSKGPILCFVGPPGTGKTSLGQSIARALGRKFYRMSLGGVRDEAEIRGHRRTYVGAMPGRVIQGIRRAESNNPVFMLDEIDKLGADFRGDPSSALLEVLDPEQNNSFQDHYLDVPFDLSKVMFIATANILDTVPPALRDRMEVLQLLGYTQDEKVHIAERHLIARQREANGLTAGQITFTRGALRYIISAYTREAGLRNLEREIGAICRGVASKIAGGETASETIKIQHIAKYLGPVRFTPETKARTSTPGVVTGLAWTQFGGDILFVEATGMKGKDRLILTGQLGDVMKESAQAALSFIRTNASKLGLSDENFENQDIHIHIPAGAIPKDGPSAGVTILTAIVSFLTRRRVIKDLAMTGEITLRGQVLPVGGIKEKVLAAHRAGIKTIIMSKENEKDLEDIPKKVQKEIQFHFVDRMLDVLKLALEK
ncbi:MAG: endopeptidase La [Deltaproteobacteria bacterium]|nr:endopeptidase La [Deltaproteobacteria bacterium]